MMDIEFPDQRVMLLLDDKKKELVTVCSENGECQVFSTPEFIKLINDSLSFSNAEYHLSMERVAALQKRQNTVRRNLEEAEE